MQRLRFLVTILTVGTVVTGAAAGPGSGSAAVLTQRLPDVLLSLPSFDRAGAQGPGRAAPPGTGGEGPPQVHVHLPARPSISLVERPFTLRTGFGFTADPTLFLLGVEGSHAVSEYVRIGPLVQLGIEDDRTIVASTVNFQFVLDLARIARHLGHVLPYLQSGLGFAYFDEDRRDGDENEVGFLINVGCGLEYYLMDNFAFGSSMLFNFMPGEVLGERAFFSWQVLTCTFRF